MQPLLRDNGLQEQFERDGFVVIPLLSAEQVARLWDLYERHIQADAVSGLYESSRHNSYEANRDINDAIRDQVATRGDLFLPSTIYGGSFMVKSHRDSEVLPLHQDWSVVEEEKFQTLFMWCPLTDVSVRDGALFVLPGSHRYFRSLRSGSYPSDRFILPPGLHTSVRDVPLKAGEAILYSDALFHGSHANNGPRDRVVVTARIMEPAATLVYFHAASAREVDVYRADPKFYLTHIDSLAKGRMPADVPRLSRRAYRHVPVTDETLQARIREHFRVPDGTTPMTQLFKDAALQETFERDGYVRIDLLERSQVDELLAFYATLRNATTPEGGFQVSLDNESPDFVRAVSEKLVATVRTSVDRQFKDHRIFTASFVTKARHPLGVVPPHQDWTFVDESRFWSATIWCPLLDVDVDNGALGLIKGSHRLYDHVRPSPSPQYSPPFKDQLLDIAPYLTIVALRAGQAVVFNNQTLHASPPNTTNQTRIAFGIGITREDAQIRHYYLLPGQATPVVEGYEVTPDFFFSYNNARLSAMYDRGERPTGLNSIGLFSLSARDYPTVDLVDRIRAAGNTEDRPLAERMAGALRALAGPSTDRIPGDGGNTAAASIATKRPLWKVYTPANVIREIRYRLGK